MPPRPDRRSRFGLQWKCTDCGRIGRFYELFCANCWQPRAMLPAAGFNPLALLEDPLVASFLVPFLESTLQRSSRRLPVLVDSVEIAVRQLQPLAVDLRDRLPNVAEITAPQARIAAEQFRMIAEVLLPWIETAFFRFQAEVLKGLPDWSAAAEIRVTALSLALQNVLDRLDALVAVLDRYGPDGWLPHSLQPIIRQLSRQLRG